MILTLLIRKQLKASLDHRWDGNPNLPYYYPEDLGIEEEGFTFLDDGYVIDGSRYFAKGVEPKALVCVFHGIGAGRNAYLKEISRLCKEGYLVYSYDNLGCMRSEGKGIGCLGRVYETQRKFFEWLETDEKSKGLKRYAFGHSWGGYQTMLSLNPNYKIEKAVALAGLVRPTDAILSRMKGPMKTIAGLPILLANRMLAGKHSNVDARKVIAKGTGKLLYIVGEKDPIVTISGNGNLLNEAFRDSSRFKYMVIPGSGHSVLYTHQSENYINDLMHKGLTQINSPIGLHMDIEKATVLNEEVMRAAFDFFKD